MKENFAWNTEWCFKKILIQLLNVHFNQKLFKCWILFRLCNDWCRLEVLIYVWWIYILVSCLSACFQFYFFMTNYMTLILNPILAALCVNATETGVASLHRYFQNKQLKKQHKNFSLWLFVYWITKMIRKQQSMIIWS